MRSLITTVAAAFAAVGTLATAANAIAVPEWDIGAYDQCVASFDGIPSTSEADYKRWQDHMKYCCEKSGGIFSYPGTGGCVAPPANPAQGRIAPPGSVATQTLEPDTPPRVIRNPGVIQTFAPAPVG